MCMKVERIPRLDHLQGHERRPTLLCYGAHWIQGSTVPSHFVVFFDIAGSPFQRG
jgi:hypothetical protein